MCTDTGAGVFEDVYIEFPSLRNVGKIANFFHFCLQTFNTDIEINYQALYRENAELQKALQVVLTYPKTIIRTCHLTFDI